MGVAVSVRTSTSWRICLRRSLWAYAEPLLLVDYHNETEVGELHILLDEPVSADADVDCAVGQRPPNECLAVRCRS